MSEVEFDGGRFRQEGHAFSGFCPTMSRLCTEFWKFASTAEVPQLGPGPRRDVLERHSLEVHLDRFASTHDLAPETALRLRAVAWVYHDHHDPAHDVVQDLSDRDSALIHAIIHRREPDYWNARYWFRQVDVHPVYLALGRRIPSLTSAPDQELLARKLTLPGAFDPFAFVDLAEQFERQADDEATVRWLRGIQHAEFEELVNHLLTT